MTVGLPLIAMLIGSRPENGEMRHLYRLNPGIENHSHCVSVANGDRGITIVFASDADGRFVKPAKVLGYVKWTDVQTAMRSHELAMRKVGYTIIKPLGEPGA